MNSPPPFSDSPRGSALLRPTDSPQQLLQAPRSTDGPEQGNADKSSASPGNAISSTSYLSVRNDSSAIPSSSSAPSLRSALRTRLFPSSSDAQVTKPETTEGSSGHRVSFEGSYIPTSTPNHSPGAKANVHPLLRASSPQTSKGMESTKIRIRRSSDPPDAPSSARSAADTTSPKKRGRESPRNPSTSNSRTTSPFRRFVLPGFHRSHDDPFIPIDPFQLRTRLYHLSFRTSDIESSLAFDPACEENPFCCLTPAPCNPDDRFPTLLKDARYFILDTLPRQLYLLLLLSMPALYFSRIARLYEDAQLSKPDLECLIKSYSNTYQLQQRRTVTTSPIPPGAHLHPEPILPFPDEWTTSNVSPALVRFKQSWEALIDSLLREWKTFNLVSALLHSAIIAMFQSQTMANDPVIRTAALLSLTSALMSLSYGCIYIVRFGTMRTMDKATRWAEESARTTTFIFWNVWVMLAMPAIWLAWSMIFFIVAIIAFVWRYGSSADPASPPLLSPSAALGPRIVISALFFLGLIYLMAIVQTLHNYGRTNESRLLGGTPQRNGTPNVVGSDGRGRTSQRGLSTSSGRDVDNSRGSQQSRRDERTQHGRDGTEPGALSAVTGLGLTGIDELVNPSRLDVISVEKQ